MNTNSNSAVERDAESESDRLVRSLLALLAQPRVPDDPELESMRQESPELEKLYSYILDLRKLSHALSRGDLHEFVFSKGFILSNLKALQSNLRHLTWQTRKVAEGDFSQRVDFLGDFSDAFNEMTIRLRDSTIQLQKLASMDVLTQIPNRLTLEEFLERSFAEAQSGGKAFSILMIDIDHFKSVNDNYGHSVGDQVLVAISEILNRQFRATDIFARYGGEEFVAGLPGTSVDIAEKIAQRALGAVREKSLPVGDDLVLSVTVSIGVSSLREGDEGYMDIIKRSDSALYYAKNSGRNRVSIL